VEIYPILDGKAILELWDSESIKGFSLRYYDRAKKKWVLYLNWPGDSRSSIGSLEGQFRNARGEFFSGGGRQLNRYTFCDITSNSLRWDDAYSVDGGKTWTNNWIMEFSRTADTAEWPKNQNAHTWHSGKRCSGKSFDHLDRFVGRWKGELDFGEDSFGKVDAQMKVYRILDGCSIIRFLECEIDGNTYRNFGLLSWNSAAGQFEELRLDNRAESPARLFRGKLEDGTISVTTTFKQNGQSKSRRHRWTLTDDATKLKLKSSLRTGDKAWRDGAIGTFKRVPNSKRAKRPPSNLQSTAEPINANCPDRASPSVLFGNGLKQIRGNPPVFSGQITGDHWHGTRLDRKAFQQVAQLFANS